MKNKDKQLYQDNLIYKALIDEFETISRASRMLGFKTRKSVNDFINSGVIKTRARNTIIKAGYNPITFKPIHTTKQWQKTNKLK